MKKLLAPITCVALGFLLGFIASRLQAGALATWYPSLVKPSMTPPSGVFPIAWSLMYLLSGLSMGRLINLRPRGLGTLIALFAAQLALCFAWSVGFFAMQSPVSGMILIILLEAVLIAYTVLAFKKDALSGWLFVPYLLWVAFATYLNGFILLNN